MPLVTMKNSVGLESKANVVLLSVEDCEAMVDDLM